MLKSFEKASPVLWLLVKREFRARYAGSTLGMLWNLLHPLILISIYILVFSSLMSGKFGGGGTRMQYAIHLTSGMIPWFLFSEVVARCTTTLVDNASFLKKLSLPEEVLHVSILLNSLFTHSVSLVALAVFLFILGVPLDWRIVFSIPVMLGMGVLGLGVGMILSVLHLVLRDIGQLVQIGLQFLFWLTPIVYPLSILEGQPGWVQALPHLNPVAPYVEMVQKLFGSSEHSMAGEAYWLMPMLPFVAVVIGLSFVRRHRSEILDLL